MTRSSLTAQATAPDGLRQRHRAERTLTASPTIRIRAGFAVAPARSVDQSSSSHRRSGEDAGASLDAGGCARVPLAARARRRLSPDWEQRRYDVGECSSMHSASAHENGLIEEE